uniref:Uncharacterized protein n=1 Tax=Anguilla anguilla TaxID=7936 RepID=A0A0E9R3A6_ANGAN
MTHKDQHTLWMASSSWRSAKLHAGRMCRIDDFEKDLSWWGYVRRVFFQDTQSK